MKAFLDFQTNLYFLQINVKNKILNILHLYKHSCRQYCKKTGGKRFMENESKSISESSNL